MRAQKSILTTPHAVTGLSLLVQIAALLFWTRWAVTQHFLSFHGLSWIVLVALASIATTLVHECGHAVLAWCFEMGFLSFRAGPFHAVKREGKWKFKLHAAGLITPGGAVGAVPTHPAQPRWEEIVMIAAGPCANLLVGTAAVWAILHDRWASYPQTWEFIAYTGAFCLIAAAINLIPFLSEDGGYSDGARILQIVTRSPIDDFHRAIASVASTAITQRRYSDLDIGQIERAAILFPHEFRGLHLLLCACEFYEESGQLSEASAALEAAQTIYDENAIDLPGPLHTVFVIGHAWLNRDAIATRLWWDRMEAKKYDHPGVHYLLAKAALFWIEGRPQQAEEAWHKAIAEAETLPQFGAFEFDRLLCTLLREAFNQDRVFARAPLAAAVRSPAPAPLSAPFLAATLTSAPLAAPIPLLASTPNLEMAPAPKPAPVITTIPIADPNPMVHPVASSPLAAAVSESVSASAIALDPAPVAAASALSPIVPIAIAEAAPVPLRPDEAIIPIAVAASVPAPDRTDVLSARLSVLTKPIPQPAPIAPLVTTVIDPIAGSMTRIPVAALQTVPAKTTLISESPAPAALALPKPNAPAVPAAFARRARTAVLPPGAASDPFVTVEALALETPQSSETNVAAASVVCTPDAVSEIVPNVQIVAPTFAPAQPAIEPEPAAAFQPGSEITDAPAAQPEKPARYDPFDFLRAAAVESLNASAT